MTSADAAASESMMLPASFAQELLWLVDRASPGSVAYNVPRTRLLRGPLDVDALRRAFDALVERHEILRTTYGTHEEQVVQIIHRPRSAPFEVVDLSASSSDARATEAARVVRERSARPFDLASDVLLRATLIRMNANEHVLLFESHHIAFDGWSRDVVFRELAACYEAFAAGREPALPALPIQYAHYAIWQREQLQGERLESLLGWWRHELSGADHLLQLPTDFPRPPMSRYEGLSRSLTIAPELRDGIRQLGQRHGATPYMVLLAAYATVLHRYTGQQDVLVGSPSAGRARPETEGLIGYFANTLVQRARFAGDPTFGEVLTRLRDSALGAYEHQDVPFEKLVLELEGRTAVGHSPLFQVVFTQLDASQAPEARMGDIVLASYALDNVTTKFDLTLFMSDRPEALSLTLRGRTDLHRASSIERFLVHLRSVLEAAVADVAVRVSAIPLLGSDERAELAAWNATAVQEGAPATLVALFEAQAARVPDRAAVVAGKGGTTADGLPSTTVLTYAELDARANQLARHLRSAGATADRPVALAIDRSADAIVGLLGILKAGAPYLPLPPTLPAARRAQQLRESGATLLVTLAAHASDAPSDVTVVALDRDAESLGALGTGRLETASAPESLAYVLYTSGSTGVPKGVAVTHANAVHYARAVSRVLADTPATAAGDGLAALDGWHFGLASTLAADLGNTSLFPALLAGGTLHVLGADVTTEPARFAHYAALNPLDVLKLTPNHLRALAAGRTGDELAAVLPARWIVLGGEALSLELARTLVGAGRGRLLNHYGPTETTVGVTTFEVTSDSLAGAEQLGAATVPLGTPLANTRAYVVDARGKEQPVGVPGELWLGGSGVAQGYLHRPELTGERFTMRDGERVYRTGDRVRRLPNGAIEFLGRVDDQVKVRGYRVELGEIESVLAQHPGVASAVAVVRDETLVAYVVARAAGYAASHGERVSPESLAALVAERLPEYMVPSAIVLLDALPLTANGKVDRAALPAPDVHALGAAHAFVAPRTPTETQLARIWTEVLKKEQVGVTDDFLELGGHSLLAIRVLGRISKTFGVRLALRTLFDAPTVEQLAEVVELEMNLAALERMSDEDAARLLSADDARGGRTE